MLRISESSAEVFLEHGLTVLRQKILAGWNQRLRQTAEAADDDLRNNVLSQVEAVARESPEFSYADLIMLADLMLVEAWNQARNRNT